MVPPTHVGPDFVLDQVLDHELVPVLDHAGARQADHQAAARTHEPGPHLHPVGWPGGGGNQHNREAAETQSTSSEIDGPASPAANPGA